MSSASFVAALVQACAVNVDPPLVFHLLLNCAHGLMLAWCA